VTFPRKRHTTNSFLGRPLTVSPDLGSPNPSTHPGGTPSPSDLWRLLWPTLAQGLFAQVVSGTSGRLALRFYASPQLQKCAFIEVDNVDRGHVNSLLMPANSRNTRIYGRIPYC
jgi:hypothetical protein